MAEIISTIVHVHLFRENGTSPEYLLLHRVPDDPIYPGIWQMVTGVREMDEKSCDAALRETKEETGLTPSQIWIVPYVGTFYNVKRDSVDMVPVFAGRVELSDEVQLSKEHDGYKWCAYEEAVEEYIIPGYVEGLKILHKCIVTGKDRDKFTQISTEEPRG
jgi:dATP pyrophosphohydrolase